jgi:hypothetical protein
MICGVLCLIKPATTKMISSPENCDEQDASVVSAEVAEEDEESGNKKDNEALAQRETKVLQLLRALLALILIASTALASWLVFRFMRGAEQQAFASQVSELNYFFC